MRVLSGVVAAAPVASLVSMMLLSGATPVLGAGAQSTPEALVARCDLPVVDLFNPDPGDMVPVGEYQISGMALDPMAAPGTSGIDQVSFFIGDRDQGALEIGSVVPSTGQRGADFSVAVNLPKVDVGKHVLLVAFAHSALSGKETQVSTPIVVGRNPSPTGPGLTAADTINPNPGVLPQTCTPADVSTLQLNPTVAATGSGGAPGAPQPVVAEPNSMAATIVGAVSTCMSGVERPLTQTTVQVQGTSASAQSDFDGEFSIAGVPAPRHIHPGGFRRWSDRHPDVCAGQSG
jgi:hypothetical protein